mmetsp:Transcript_4985/g.12129  ORF Transcript_4985/g.12129 Transcript_4985/m.12129 type:complete len:223 (+) Transcript_4985:203-871(+)
MFLRPPCQTKIPVQACYATMFSAQCLVKRGCCREDLATRTSPSRPKYPGRRASESQPQPSSHRHDQRLARLSCPSRMQPPTPLLFDGRLGRNFALVPGGASPVHLHLERHARFRVEVGLGPYPGHPARPATEPAQTTLQGYAVSPKRQQRHQRWTSWMRNCCLVAACPLSQHYKQEPTTARQAEVKDRGRKEMERPLRSQRVQHCDAALCTTLRSHIRFWQP